MRRFLLGAAAAVALLALAPPAQAHHDQTCVPGVPGPVCVTGLQHVVPETKAEAWEAFHNAFMPVALAVLQQQQSLDAIPEPLCVPGVTPICVSGLRANAQFGYFAAWFVAFVPAYVAVCTAIGPPECAISLPPV